MSKTDPGVSGSVDTGSVIALAVKATPQWVLGLCGGMVTLAVCMIAVLQLGGFSGPIGRIMNAKATEIERAAESITSSATQIDTALLRLQETEERVGSLEVRVGKLEDSHIRLGVK